MCRGIFGCRIRVVGCVMSVTPSSPHFTEGTIAGSVAEFSVGSVQHTQFQSIRKSPRVIERTVKELGFVTIALGNGSKDW